MATATAELQAAGWAPRWWRDGVRTPLWWAAAILGPGLLVASTITAYDHGFPPALCALRATAFMAEVVVGLLFWMWRPRNIIGPLLVTYPVLFVVFEDLVHWFPHSRLAVTLLFFNVLWWPLFALMLFVFPTGSIWNAWARGAWLCVWVMALTFFPPFLLFVPAGIPMDYGVTQVPSYFYVGHGWSGLERWGQGWWIAECVVFLLVSTVLIARLVGASPGARRRLVPLFAVFIVMDTFKDIYILVHVLKGEPFLEGWFRYVWYVPIGLSAAAAAFGLGLTRRARSSVSDLVVELGEVEPGQVRAALARTLGRSVARPWPLAARPAGVGRRARARDRSPDRWFARAYVHRRAARGARPRPRPPRPARLLESVGSAARLALENERLQAELRAQLGELRDSRARIVSGRQGTTPPRARPPRRRATTAARARDGPASPRTATSTRRGRSSSPRASSSSRRRCRSSASSRRASIPRRSPTTASPTRSARSPSALPSPSRPTWTRPWAASPAMSRPPRTSSSPSPSRTSRSTRRRARPGSPSVARTAMRASRSATTARAAPRPTAGTGLRGLADRVGALDGDLTIDSPPAGHANHRRDPMRVSARRPDPGAPRSPHRGRRYLSGRFLVGRRQCSPQGAAQETSVVGSWLASRPPSARRGRSGRRS